MVSYTRTNAFADRTRAIGPEVSQELDAISSAFTQADAVLTRALRLPSGNDGDITENSVNRANKVIGFDADGNLQLQPGVGQWRGDWATSTEYQIRDVFRDAAGDVGLNNLYIVTEPHTSTTLASDSAKYELLINVVDVETAKTAAEDAQTAAELAETNAGNSETAASNSAAAASTSETNAGNAKTAAESAQSAAETAQSGAETAKDDAQTAQTASETAQGLSESARDKAEKWAEEDEDVEVETGQYSAFHWAAKAEQAVADGVIDDSASSALTTYSSEKIDADFIPSSNAPTGDIVGTTDSQTLTNKTLSFSGNTLTGVVGTTATQTLTNKTLESPAIDGYSETVHALTGTTPAIDNSNGTIQTWTLTGNSTPTDSLSVGESVTLMIDDGTANTVTWTMVDKWFGGVPELSTTEYTAITLWKVGSTVYGATLPEIE